MNNKEYDCDGFHAEKYSEIGKIKVPIEIDITIENDSNMVWYIHDNQNLDLKVHSIISKESALKEFRELVSAQWIRFCNILENASYRNKLIDNQD